MIIVFQSCKIGSVIVDFCAGGGHVGLAVASHFPETTVVIVDYKSERNHSKN